MAGQGTDPLFRVAVKLVGAGGAATAAVDVALALVGAGGAATAAVDVALALVGVVSGASELALELHAANSSATAASPAMDVLERLMSRTSCQQRRLCPIDSIPRSVGPLLPDPNGAVLSPLP